MHYHLLRPQLLRPDGQQRGLHPSRQDLEGSHSPPPYPVLRTVFSLCGVREAGTAPAWPLPEGDREREKKRERERERSFIDKQEVTERERASDNLPIEALTLALGAAEIHDVYGCSAPYDKTDGLRRLWRRIQLDELPMISK